MSNFIYPKQSEYFRIVQIRIKYLNFDFKQQIALFFETPRYYENREVSKKVVCVSSDK